APVQVPARADLARSEQHLGAPLQLAWRQVGDDVIGAQPIELVEPLFQVRQVQGMAEQVGEGALQGQRQVGASQFDRLDEAFDDDDLQRLARFGLPGQVGTAGRIAGLHVTLGDGLQQPVDVSHAHAGTQQWPQGSLQRWGGERLVASQAYAWGRPAVGVRLMGGGGRRRRGTGALALLPALQPLLVLQLLERALLFAQLLAGRVVGQGLGHGQETGQQASQQPPGGVEAERGGRHGRNLQSAYGSVLVCEDSKNATGRLDASPCPPACQADAELVSGNSEEISWIVRFQGRISIRVPSLTMLQTSRMSSLRMAMQPSVQDRKSTRLNSSHVKSSYAVSCSKKTKRKPRNL